MTDTKKKKKGFTYLESFSFLLEMSIAIGAAIWFIYVYVPQYYLILSFLLLAVAGIFAYVFLTKAIRF